jgi:hypothetical protein
MCQDMKISRLQANVAAALMLAALTAAAVHFGIEGLIEAIYDAGYSTGAWLRGG